MPNRRPLPNDNESIRSSESNHSFSTACRSIPPAGQLRRRRTVTQLTRWVSKRMSRSSMPALGQSIELTETNIRALDATVETHSDRSLPQLQAHSDPQSHSQSQTQYAHSPHHQFLPYTPPSPTFDSKTQHPDFPHHSIEGIPQRRQSKRVQRDREREKRVRRSYAEFCEDFTLSGPIGPIKEYDMTMDLTEHEEPSSQPTPPPAPQPFQRAGLYHTDHPSAQSPSSYEHQQFHHHQQDSPYSDARQDAINSAMWTRPYDSQSIWSQSSSAPGPRPPSPIMTPTVYKEMQRAVQAKKQARKRKILAPFRALFGSVQPMRKQWFNIDH
ncbi:Uncharacterized protein PECH_007984 [Penicillium ucsense]|nr:Uncharacterized protein PECH_007984 [Penicillium ucsense]